MPGGGNGFFRASGDRKLEELERTAFNIAYFWKVSPEHILALPISRFLKYERHAERIAEELKNNHG